LASDVVAVEDGPAARRVVGAGQQVEDRRLAGAVGPDQADDRPLRDREVDVVDGDEAAEDLAHHLGRQQVVGHQAPPCRTSERGSSDTPSWNSAARLVLAINPPGRKIISTSRSTTNTPDT